MILPLACDTITLEKKLKKKCITNKEEKERKEKKMK